MDNQIVSKIILGNEQLSKFWLNSHGWAPVEAADLMSKSRLDWQVLLSETLVQWAENEINEGQLILAWANLGALIEGTLKLFLSVYYDDYQKDEERYKKKNGNTIDPDALALEKLKQFFKKKELLSSEQLSFIELVQQRRNAIHAFKDRPLGSKDEFLDCLSKYLDLMRDVSSRLPYPDDMYKPQF